MKPRAAFSPTPLITSLVLVVALACTCNMSSLFPSAQGADQAATAVVSNQWTLTLVPTAWAPTPGEILDHVTFEGAANGGIVSQTGLGSSIGDYTLAGSAIAIALTRLHENCRIDLVGKFSTPTKMEGTYTNTCATPDVRTGAWTATVSK